MQTTQTVRKKSTLFSLKENREAAKKLSVPKTMTSHLQSFNKKHSVVSAGRMLHFIAWPSGP